jgi:hypothetical protein
MRIHLRRWNLDATRELYRLDGQRVERESRGLGRGRLGSDLARFVALSRGGEIGRRHQLRHRLDHLHNGQSREHRTARADSCRAPESSAGRTADGLGPIAATHFEGTVAHFTSPGVRVNLLDPTTIRDTSNPPNDITMPPALPNQNYRIPDPGGHANYVLSPDSGQLGLNVLDCTLAGISCKRYGFAYFEGGGCNGTSSGLGWDTFSSSAPVPICITGTNIQKGVLALPAAVTKLQENTGTGAAAGTCTTTYPAATSAGDFLVAGVVVDGGKTVTGITDGTNAYTSAVTAANGNTRLEVWYFNGNSAAKVAGTTLTVTLSAAANCAIDWLSYKDVLTAAALDVTQSLTGTGTAVSTGGSGGTTVPVELILSFVGSPSNPSVAYQAGHVGHATVSQSTNVTISSQGVIQQATTPQSGTFTLGSSQAWVAALATFKANVLVNPVAQRHLTLPPTFVPSIPVNTLVKWQAPSPPTGVTNVMLATYVVCTADGATDDPAFLVNTPAIVPVNASISNAITTTTLNGMNATGCAPNSLMHLQVQRVRYNVADTYEGYVYVNGVGLQFGVQ